MYGFHHGYAPGRPLAGSAATGTPTPPPGPVESAAIEADGTVLALVIRGVDSGSWADYGFAGGMTQAVMAGVSVATTTAGFDRSGGQAIADLARSRPLIALKPCRKTPIVPSSAIAPNATVLDEVDNGDGTRTVRLRLSRYAYQGDVCTLSLADGWRTGAPAQSGIAVTNDSTRPAPMASGGRWLTPPKQCVTGSFRVDVMAGSVNPEGKSGIAAVKFDVTDGITTKTVWADGLSTSTAYGDSVRCWGADIDPSGFNPGLITVHKTIYPWIGPSRTSGGGQSNAAGSFVGSADAPLVMAYDPAGTRYAIAWVACDPVNGTIAPSAAMVQPSLAAAKAVAATSKPKDASTAQQAVYLANRNAAAANGQAALTRMADNYRIVIPAGTTPWGATSTTTGLSSTECWPIIIGDPDDANPRANCIFEAAATAPNLRMSHLALHDLTVKVGGAFLGNNAYWWLHNVQVEGKTGQGSSSVFLTSVTASFCYATKCDAGTTTQASFTQAGTGNRFALIRSCSAPRDLKGLAIVNSTGSSLGGWSNIGDADSQSDWVCVNSSALRSTVNAVNWSLFTIDGYKHCVRPLVANLVIERITTDLPIWQMGENSFERYTNAVIEGISAVGQRCNTFYNDPTDLTSHNVHVDCRVANSYFDWLPTKQDDFHDDGNPSNDGAPNHGYRPWLTENLWFQDGTNCEGNVHARRLGSGNFTPHGYGIGAVINPSTSTSQGNSWSMFNNDQSSLGAGSGGGDYRPTSGSPLIGVAVSANLDVDRAGVARGSAFATGALEPA